MAETKKYKFESILERQRSGMGYHCIYFPYSAEKEFGKKGHIRIWGVYNGVKAERALIPHGNGEHYIIFGTDLRRKMGLQLGDVVQAEVWLNTEPRKLDIPEELEAVFELEPLAHERFKTKLKPGTQRSICYWVNSAKREETRTKRALDMMNRLLSDVFEMGGRKIDMV